MLARSRRVVPTRRRIFTPNRIQVAGSSRAFSDPDLMLTASSRHRRVVQSCGEVSAGGLAGELASPQRELSTCRIAGKPSELAAVAVTGARRWRQRSQVIGPDNRLRDGPGNREMRRRRSERGDAVSSFWWTIVFFPPAFLIVTGPADSIAGHNDAIRMRPTFQQRRGYKRSAKDRPRWTAPNIPSFALLSGNPPRRFRLSFWDEARLVYHHPTGRIEGLDHSSAPPGSGWMPVT
jgi:hypothetical protein